MVKETKTQKFKVRGFYIETIPYERAAKILMKNEGESMSYFFRKTINKYLEVEKEKKKKEKKKNE